MNNKNSYIAQKYLNIELPLGVLVSGRGYYLGAIKDGIPVSRDSEEYWQTKEEALTAYVSNEWTQRVHP